MANVSPSINNDDSDNFCSDDEEKVILYGSTNKCMNQGSKIRIDSSEDDNDSADEVRTAHSGLLGNHPEQHTTLTSVSNQHADVDVTSKTFRNARLWQQFKDTWKFGLSALCLLISGITLIVIAIVIEISGTTVVQSFIFFILGALCFIPGIYHVVFIYYALRGKKGFNIYSIMKYQ